MEQCLLLGVLAILLTGASDVKSQEIFGYCTTPDESNGRCINLRECRYLFEMVQRGALSPQDRKFLQDSQCGYRNGQVLICCANSGTRNQQPQWGNQGQPAPRPVTQPSSSGSGSSLLPKAPYCGDNFENRVVGGVETGKREFPWMALIEYTKPGNIKGHHCGGSLINNRYVLTAAHCVAAIPADWRLTGVRLGDWDTRTNPDCTTELNGRRDCNDPFVDIAVSERIPHPQYPVCLPSLPTQRDQIFLGSKVVVAGWGRTETNSTSNIKLKAELDPVPTSTCNERYASQRRTVTDNQLCAGGVEGVDSCRGDSGGPLLLEDYYEGNSNYYIAGVVSYGPTPCGLKGWPGVYTRVAAYLDFIENNIRP